MGHRCGQASGNSNVSSGERGENGYIQHSVEGKGLSKEDWLERSKWQLREDSHPRIRTLGTRSRMVAAQLIYLAGLHSGLLRDARAPGCFLPIPHVHLLLPMSSPTANAKKQGAVLCPSFWAPSWPYPLISTMWTSAGVLSSMIKFLVIGVEKVNFIDVFC